MIANAKLKPNTVIYMDYGSKELRNHNKMRSYFAKISSLLLRKRVLLESRIIPGGEHCEASWERQIPFFINTLLYEP